MCSHTVNRTTFSHTYRQDRDESEQAFVLRMQALERTEFAQLTIISLERRYGWHDSQFACTVHVHHAPTRVTKRGRRGGRPRHRAQQSA